MYTSIPNINNGIDESLPTNIGKSTNKVRNVLWYMFLLTFLGTCIMFGSYITTFYIPTIINNHLNEWEIATPRLYHPDRPDSSIAMSIHLFGAAYLMLLGMLQYIPYIRQRYIAFHKYNGRFSLVSIILASIGGIYYACAVGLSAAPLIGEPRIVRLIDVSNVLFGVATFTCGCGIYYHGAYTKQIDLHKRWAYRIAGLFFGNIFARLYLLSYFIIMGEEANLIVKKVSFTLLALVYWPLFMILGDYIWRREQKEDSNGNDTAIYKVVVFGILLFVFIVTVVMQSLFAWIPAMKERRDGYTHV